jgi:PAS domain S-box-containing protein
MVRRSNQRSLVPTLTHFEALGAALAGNRHTAVIYAGADGVIGFWNAGAEALFGHSPVEALGKRVDLIVPEEISGDALGRIWAGDRIRLAGQRRLGSGRRPAQEWRARRA